MSEQVPVIDITRLDEGHSLRAIDEACREWGFFQVTGHGIETGVIGQLSAIRRFFAQPAEAKRSISRTADNPWGFYDKELTKNTRDWKEVFDFGPADGNAIVPQWPQELPQFEPAMRAYCARCESLAHRLLAAARPSSWSKTNRPSPNPCNTHSAKRDFEPAWPWISQALVAYTQKRRSSFWI